MALTVQRIPSSLHWCLPKMGLEFSCQLLWFVSNFLSQPWMNHGWVIHLNQISDIRNTIADFSILNLFVHLTEIVCLLTKPHQSLSTSLQWSFYFYEFSILHSIQKWDQIVSLHDFIQHVFHVYLSCKWHSLLLFKNEYYYTTNYIFFVHQWKEIWFCILATMKNKQIFLLLTIYIHTCFIIYKRLQKHIIELFLIFEKLIWYFS